MQSEATHAYIARASCGCITGFRTDHGDKSTGQAVAEFIADGNTIERVTIADARKVHWGCTCAKVRTDSRVEIQASMF